MFDWPTVDHGRLRASRAARVRELMERLGMDHLLVTGFDTMRFVADFRSLVISEGFDWFALLADAEGEAEVFVPWVDEEVPDPSPESPSIRVAHPLPSWSPASPQLDHWVRSLGGRLRARGARRVGLDLLWGDLLDALRADLPQLELVPIGTELYDLRMVKDPIEIELLAAASHVNALAAEAAMAAARAGMLDHDVLAVAMETLQRLGVEYMSHSLCNVRRGSGTWFSVGNELREGDAFFFDIGCYGLGGYASDMARTGFVGEPPAPVAGAYRRLLEAHRVGEEIARPGVRASEVHEAINAHLRSHGLPITPYATGHGLGLRACELPTIHRADRMARDQVLAEGVVIALEPETAVEVAGRLVVLKIEDDYLVERDGVRRLTDAGYGPLAG